MSLEFSSEEHFKNQLVAELAAVLAFMATRNKDKVGMLIFSDHVERIDKSQAIEFLTRDSSHLRLICELAGRNPDYVRSKIRNKLLNGMDTR